jgi:hypothetical protein
MAQIEAGYGAVPADVNYDATTLLQLSSVYGAIAKATWPLCCDAQNTTCERKADQDINSR